MKKSNKVKRNITLIAMAGTLAVFLYWQNNDIMTTKITYQNNKIPTAFDGFVIVQVSDLHNMRFGKDNNVLLKKIKDADPDMIALTGDLIDNVRTDLSVAIEFIRDAVAIAPVYYVPGNHEARISNYNQLAASMSELGVQLLENKQVKFQQGNASIELSGIIDPFFSPAKDSLNHLDFSDQSVFRILLSHRPELIKLYASKQIDLVLTGHAHGGQIRIPTLRGGLIAPDQGLFPKYTSGIYNESETSEIVSRGLGNSTFPFRVFNRPEIIVVTLKSK
jgi:predicted MPP superfamily phosphohydrolase